MKGPVHCPGRDKGMTYLPPTYTSHGGVIRHLRSYCKYGVTYLSRCANH